MNMVIPVAVFLSSSMYIVSQTNLNSCFYTALDDAYEILEPLQSVDSMVTDSHSVTVLCKASSASSIASCQNGSWIYTDAICLGKSTSLQPMKRKKRFLFAGVLFFIGLFTTIGIALTTPRARDRTDPYFLNCPDDLYAQAIPIQMYSHVRWTVPTAKDSHSRVRVRRNGRGPGSLFWEGSTPIKYSAQDRSGNIAFCSFDVNIEVVRCPRLSLELSHGNGFRLCHPSRDMVQGTSCRYGCYQGHILKGGSSRRKCLSTGRWSSSREPYCEKIKCPDLSPTKPTSVSCSNQYYFRSICSFFCVEGFEIPDRVSRAKVCLASGYWNGDNPICRDIQPPFFEQCKDTLMFFPDNNHDKAYVNWTIPKVSDNKDTHVMARQTAGPSQATSLNVGTYTITYKATDRAGNEAEPCSFTVVVKQLRCRRIYPLPYMNVNCTGTRRGSTCSFSCDSNSELNGTDLTYCHRVHEMPYSLWDMEKQPFCQVSEACPRISAPDFGALACGLWLGGRICHPSCRMGYSVLAKVDGKTLPQFVICAEDKQWLNKDEIRNCVAKSQKFRRKRLASMSSEFYFDGNCHDPEVQFVIRKTFIDLLMSSNKWRPKCTSGCYIENVQVICGNSSRKRSTTNLAIDMTLVFETNVTFTSDLYEEEVSSISGVADAIKEVILNINITYNNSSLNLVSMSTGSLEIECLNNSVPVYGDAIGCVPCPVGTFYVADNETCQPCPRGSYQPLTSQSECFPCLPTQTTAVTGSTNSSDCEDACEPGTWSPTGLPPCIECDIGYVEELYGSLKCAECPGNQITITEGSSNVSDCFDFDIVFPNGTDASTTIFDDPIGPISLPFVFSMHVKTASSEGNIILMTDGKRDILNIDTSGVNLNEVDEPFPLGIDLRTKWFHIAVYFDDNETTVYIDGKPKLLFDDIEGRTVSNINIQLGGDGFVGEISQLVVTEESDLMSNVQSYASCKSNDGPVGKVNWKDFAYSSLNNSYIRVPSYCDDVDDCASSPCINGSCTDRRSGYTCKCIPGFKGMKCDVNIDDCIAQMCQNNATCIDGVTNYTCACKYGFTGELCEIAMVDGQWSSWEEWTDCSVSCGNGSRQRRRSCSNPQPDNGGKFCEGNDSEIDECILETCRECLELVATNHSTLTCTNTSGMIVCKHSCDDGYWFDKDVRDDYRCGNETFYYWDFQTEENPYARLPFCTEIAEASKIYLDHTAYYDLEHCQDDLKDTIDKKLSAIFLELRCRNASFCELEEYEILNCGEKRREKRDLSSATVGYTVTISCDPEKYGTEDCAYNLADGIREIKTLENGTAFDIYYQSETYQISPNSSRSGSRMDCSKGSIPNMIFCVPCSVGHYYSDEECIPCAEGTYQSETGQTFCSLCPAFTTTEGTASIGLEDCNVVVPDDTNNTVLYVVGTIFGFALAVLVMFIIHRRNKIIEKTTYKFGMDVSYKSEKTMVDETTDDGGVNLMSYVLKSEDDMDLNQKQEKL